ncbi:MAG: UDP-N-acetylmuramoyl-L-alanyl-D-glutamate--2,6-diaminopimelate ligase [Acidobacteria bacterium]|nr:UDP-N-acetylmuramoyl-L-alanyl-D-glutamate--2,6-diaminopimelate ligase [Acidobacteriota bacterium]
MTLEQLFERVPEARFFSDPEQVIQGLEYHSQRISPGQVFFAIRGWKQDGTRFIPEAVARGAVAIVSESPPESFSGMKAPTWVQVPNARRALALAANQFYEYPSRQLRLVGVTGTNGKTTVAFLVASILKTAGWKPALLGTIGYSLTYGETQSHRPAPNTTPESLDLQRMLREVVNAGGRAAAMEVSSHSLSLDRITGCSFHTAVLTNFARDHLDFHGDLENYYAAKEKLFLASEETPAPAFAVLNADDPRCSMLRGKIGSPVVTYAVEAEADVAVRKWKATREGLEFMASTPAGSIEVRSPLLGHHNLYNLLAAVSVALTLEVSLEEIQQGVLPLRVPGRMETINLGQPFSVIVDYAHTDEALRNLVASARPLAGEGRLILVFGCGGDRDRTKRPLMGMAASACDLSVLTSDNPRSEDPLQIMNDVMVGLQKANANYVVELDRRQAIARAFREAHAGDVVLLAGKGHESIQIIGEQQIPFDDREVARDVLRELGFDAPSEPRPS